ncbi:MAG: hypothetical protein QOJ99_5207 [Bryobacterales bacterium]|jgi:hypothetical protein|nr:hypothetical protein [Bryobacterales bacterium]
MPRPRQGRIEAGVTTGRMDFDDYKVDCIETNPMDGLWRSAQSLIAIPSCRPGKMPSLNPPLFFNIAEEYRDHNQPLPADTTEIVHA